MNSGRVMKLIWLVTSTALCHANLALMMRTVRYSIALLVGRNALSTSERTYSLIRSSNGFAQ